MSDILDKINQICRVCLLEQPMMFSIFNKNDTEPDVSQMLNEFTTIKIDLNDNLPQLVCSSCLERLGIAYSFKQDCKKSDETLHKLILENEDKFDTKQFIPHNIFLSNEVENQVNPDYETANVNAFVKVELNEDITDEEEEDAIKTEQDDEKDVDFQLSSSEIESDDSDSLNLLELKEKLTKKPKKEKIEGKTTKKKRDKKGNVKFECQICKRTFKEHILLWRHRGKVHNDSYFSCYVCWKPFPNLESLQKHDEEHQNRTYVCDQDHCDEEFNNFRLYILHRKNNHAVEKYIQCSECEINFAGHKQWDIHIQKHIFIQNRCELCLIKFSTDKEFEDHINAQHPGYLTCSICAIRYPTKKSFDQHLQTHATYICEECGSQFKKKHKLTEHIKYKHQGVPRKKNKKYIEKNNHLCPKCGIAFQRPFKLQLHLQKHAGVKAFACELCDHRTTSKTLLRNHMRTHTGERPFICDICGKGFSFKCYLYIHKRWHTGYRPYKCSYLPCDKGFTTKGDLKVHERSHTGVKLFECQICHSSFTTLHYLKVHTAKHGDTGN